MLLKYKMEKWVQALVVFCLGLLLFSGIAGASSNEARQTKAHILADGHFAFARLEDGQYTITARINGGEPLVFMVDTGASRTSIFETTRKRLGIEKQRDVKKNIRGMISSEIRPTLILNKLEFAGNIFNNHTVVVLGNWPEQTAPLDGILGMDVLSGLILSFEHEAVKPTQQGLHSVGHVKLLKKRALRARKYKKWTWVKLTGNPYPNAEFGLVFTYTDIGRLRIPTLFDTGSSFTAVSWDIVEGTAVLKREKRRLREEWTIHGAIGAFKPKLRILMEGLNIGGVDLKKHELLIMDFDNLPINNHGTYPLVIIGIDFLGGHDFILDMEAGNLILDVKPKRKRPNTEFNSIQALVNRRSPL